MMRLRGGWALLALLALAGCVSAEMRRARVVQESLVDRTRAQLLACSGEPQGETRQGDRIILTYFKSCGTLEQGFSTTRSTVTRVPRHGCQATVELEGDRVRRVKFSPVPNNAEYEVYHCEELFEACKPAAPPSVRDGG